MPTLLWLFGFRQCEPGKFNRRYFHIPLHMLRASNSMAIINNIFVLILKKFVWLSDFVSLITYSAFTSPEMKNVTCLIFIF